ncbi:MAG: J domain-containing protein, partial [Hyphomicrobium sp.]
APKRPAETSVTNAAASVSALIEQANGSLDVLRGAPPLREVLEQEIGVIRQRLAIVKAQASDSPEAAHKSAPAFRTLVRDLERVRRISESAALSFSRERVVGRVPRTRSEAYDVLGVNADVSDQTLKKLVDALRMCWHPDLAKDEPDRLLREERIKCINVAWELISGKRAAM